MITFQIDFLISCGLMIEFQIDLINFGLMIEFLIDLINRGLMIKFRNLCTLFIPQI